MTVLARRYATALFQAAESSGEMDGVKEAVEIFDEALKDPGARAFLLSRELDPAKKAVTLEKAAAGAPRTFANFLKVVTSRSAEAVLIELGAEFARLDRRRRGEAKGVVEVARALQPEELTAVRAKLEAHLGLKLELEVVVNPELIGGLRATVEAQRIDASVAKRMEELKRSMSQAAG